MRLVVGIIFDLLLLPAVWMCGNHRVVFLLTLAAGNALYYVFLLTSFFYRMCKDENRKGFTLEFVVIQFFICAAVFMYKVSDLLILRKFQ